MKERILAIALLSGLVTLVQTDASYSLIINGVTNDVHLGASQILILPGGEKLEVVLNQNETGHVVHPMFTFSHPGDLTMSSSLVGEGIQQSLLTSPKGVLILIQEYENTNPDALVEIMLEEITKDEIAAGYDHQTSAVSKTAGDATLQGRRAVTSTGHSNWVREVYSVSSGESGVLIVTAIETKNNAKEQPVLDLFWESLSLTINEVDSRVEH